MHICYVCVGGFQHIQPYIDYFKGTGHRVSFIALSPTPDRGVTTYQVALAGRYSRTEGKWKYPLSMIRARRVVRQLKPDILHTHYVTSGGLAGLVCNFHPTVTTAHGTDLSVGSRSRLWRPLLRRIFSQATCVNTVSADLKNKAVALGVPDDKVRVLTLGVDTRFFAYQPRQPLPAPTPLRLLSTRRLEHVYDHPTAIKALALLRDAGIPCEMTFSGGGSLKATLQELVRTCHLDDRVRFLDAVSRSQVLQLLHNHDVFLSHPRWDGISVALLEAMATGLFPITSDLPVNREWLDEGVTTLFHPVGDAAALAQCLTRAYEQPEFRLRAASLNRQRVEAYGDTTNNMRILETLYRELIDATKPT